MRRRQLLQALLLVRHLSTLAPWRPQPLARMVFRHHCVCSRTGVVFRRLWCGSISNAGRASRGSRDTPRGCQSRLSAGGQAATSGSGAAATANHSDIVTLPFQGSAAISGHSKRVEGLGDPAGDCLSPAGGSWHHDSTRVVTAEADLTTCILGGGSAVTVQLPPRQSDTHAQISRQQWRSNH